jgi:hypothetical protein
MHALKATWRSGYATVCKTVYPGSIPGVASNNQPERSQAPPLAAVAISDGTTALGGVAGAAALGCCAPEAFGHVAVKFICHAAKEWCYAVSLSDSYGIPAYIDGSEPPVRRHDQLTTNNLI